MKCENCGKNHDGTYGSGRFCNTICSHTFAANCNKVEKGKKISQFMKNRWKQKPHIDPSKFNKLTKKALQKQKENREILYQNGNWDELPLSFKRRRVIEEQNDKCAICRINSWQGKLLILQFDHINGDKTNDNRDNVRFICPNCHSQTETYCGKKRRLPQFKNY